MTIELVIRCDTVVPGDIDHALRNAAQTVLDNREVLSAELTILLTDDEALRSLNRQYSRCGQDDRCLKFCPPATRPGVPAEPVYLGDIAISVPYAGRQARTKGHSTAAELQLLTVHGILHLLGYDHGLPSDKSAMWSIQREVLQQLGLADVEPTEDG